MGLLFISYQIIMEEEIISYLNKNGMKYIKIIDNTILGVVYNLLINNIRQKKLKNH